MMFSISHFFTGIEDALAGIGIPILLGTGATVVRTAQHGWHGVLRFLCELSLSIFVGLIIHWSLTAYDVQPTLVCAVVSASSFFCGVILDAMRKRIVHEILHRGRANPEAVKVEEENANAD